MKIKLSPEKYDLFWKLWVSGADKSSYEEDKCVVYLQKILQMKIVNWSWCFPINKTIIMTVYLKNNVTHGILVSTEMDELLEYYV